MSEIIDHLDSNIQPSPPDWDLYSGLVTSVAQSFTGDGRTLDRAKFYICKVGNPTGNVYVKLYEHTGTFGTDSKPTGAALATSDAIDISGATIPSDPNPGWVEFHFSTPYTLVNGMKYCSAIEFNGGNSTNKLYVFDSDVGGGGADHPGNAAQYALGSWNAFSAKDLEFFALSDQGGLDESIKAVAWSG